MNPKPTGERFHGLLPIHAIEEIFNQNSGNVKT